MYMFTAKRPHCLSNSLESLSRTPLVKDCVQPDPAEQKSEQPEQEVEEEHGVLDPRADVSEVGRVAAAADAVATWDGAAAARATPATTVATGGRYWKGKGKCYYNIKKRDKYIYLE